MNTFFSVLFQDPQNLPPPKGCWETVGFPLLVTVVVIAALFFVFVYLPRRYRSRDGGDDYTDPREPGDSDDDIPPTVPPTTGGGFGLHSVDDRRSKNGQ